MDAAAVSNEDEVHGTTPGRSALYVMVIIGISSLFRQGGKKVIEPFKVAGPNLMPEFPCHAICSYYFFNLG
jgi:hypothetical protein